MNTSTSRERAPLLKKYEEVTMCFPLKVQYRKTRKCLSSKGALVLLMMSFAVFSLYSLIWSQAAYFLLNYIHNNYVAIMITYGMGSIVFCFCPLAGYLADNRYGQYKTVIFSLWIFFLLSILFSTFVSLVITAHIDSDSVVILYIAIGLLTISFPLLFIANGTFQVTIVPLALDQLYDFKTEEQSLFIHWFFWIFSLSKFFTELVIAGIEYPYTVFNKVLFNISTTQKLGYRGISGYAVFCILLVFLILLSLYALYFKKTWFWIEPSRVNPYKLVYKVTQFSWQHKVPLNRSAFTYCEDDIPRGLNLAKNKYGGPFTTEQVEDVKVFYGIIKVLLILLFICFLNVAEHAMMWRFVDHGSVFQVFQNNDSSIIYYNTNSVTKFLIVDKLLIVLVILICIPLYLFFIRPFFLKYIPGILKRMGIGILMKVLSLVCTLIIGAWAHSRYDVGCLFNESSSVVTLNDTSNELLFKGPFYDMRLLSIQFVLHSLSYMLIEISVYEFICSQSPHTMKGLIIGVFLFLKGMYTTLGVFLSLPFSTSLVDHSHVSCGVSYYAMNVGVGVVTLLAYIWVVRKYKYRERDEVPNIYMYAENYYSKGPPEQ